METSVDTIEKATSLQKEASGKIGLAIRALEEAQNAITNVEGQGSADIYSEIADHYTALRDLKHRVDDMQPTGLFDAPSPL